MFLSAYERTDNFDCAYNAAIITEELQEYDEAERMMNDLYMKTYDKRASKALAQIKREKEYDAKLKLQNEKRR